MNAVVPGSILLISIATNGYDRHFSKLLETQRAYAAKIGADYFLASTSPPWGISGPDSAWLKVPLLAAGLRRGYEWVLFLDADCEVRDCPSPAREFANEPRPVLMCHDFSGRLNSGVIFLRNRPAARRILRMLYWSSFVPAALHPVEDRNIYENGHVIHYLKNDPEVRVIDPRWNCQAERGLSDPFIFHYGGAPARAPQRRSPWREAWKKFAALTTGFRLPLHAQYYLRSLPRPEASASLR